MADLNESEKEAVPTKAKSESPTASQAPSVTDESPAEQAKPLSDTSEFAQASPVEAAAPPKPTAIKLPRRWAVSLLFTPQFANSAYSANSSADLEWFNDYYHNRVNNDKARFCYNAGLKAEGRFGKHFGIATGGIVSVIQFEELQVIKTIDTLPQPTTKVSTGTVVVPLLDSLGRPIAQTTANIDRNRVDISFTSLEIPLLMNYTVDGKRFQWQLSAGVGYNYLLSTHSLVFEKNDTLNAQETNDASNSRLQQHRFSFIAGLYVAYRFTPGFAFYIGPSYRQSLGSLYNKDYVIRQRPYFIGAECGLKFSF